MTCLANPIMTKLSNFKRRPNSATTVTIPYTYKVCATGVYLHRSECGCDAICEFIVWGKNPSFIFLIPAYVKMVMTVLQ